MRVAILYNEPKPFRPEKHWLSRSAPGGTALAPDFVDPSEYGICQDAQIIEEALRDGGHETTLFAVDDPARLANFLASQRPDIIFNGCEAFFGKADLEMNIAAVYELFQIPFTGSSALTLGMALNKGIAKTIFQGHGVPTPPFAVLTRHSEPDAAVRLGFPRIVKPLCEDASLGIDAHAVVETADAMWRRAQFVWREFHQPALVEEFVDGRELNVAVLAASSQEFVSLPVSEIVFTLPPGKGPRIVGYEAKWIVDSEDYVCTMPKCPADLPLPVAEQVRAISLRAARAIGLRDYGRIDLRVRDTDNAVFVLEVNPNPDVTHDSGFVRAAQASGRSHADLLREILERAIERSSCNGVREQAQVNDDTTVGSERS